MGLHKLAGRIAGEKQAIRTTLNRTAFFANVNAPDRHKMYHPQKTRGVQLMGATAGGGYGYGGGFALLVVLFILLIIIGASYVGYGY